MQEDALCDPRVSCWEWDRLRFIFGAYTGKSSTGSDEEQSSGKEANADPGHGNGIRKDKGLLGGDKVLWSNRAKSGNWEWDRKNSEIRQSYVSLGNDVTKTVNLEDNRKLGYRGGGL